MADRESLNAFGTYLDTLRRLEAGSSDAFVVEEQQAGPVGPSASARAAAARVRSEEAVRRALHGRAVVQDPEGLLLDVLTERGPMSLPDLVRPLGGPLKTLLRALERLEHFGLIAREGPEGAEVFRITDSGRKAREAKEIG